MPCTAWPKRCAEAIRCRENIAHPGTSPAEIDGEIRLLLVAFQQVSLAVMQSELNLFSPSAFYCV